MVAVRPEHAGRAAHQANTGFWRTVGTEEKNIAAEVKRGDAWRFIGQKGFSAESNVKIRPQNAYPKCLYVPKMPTQNASDTSFQ